MVSTETAIPEFHCSFSCLASSFGKHKLKLLCSSQSWKAGKPKKGNVDSKQQESVVCCLCDAALVAPAPPQAQTGLPMVALLYCHSCFVNWLEILCHCLSPPFPLSEPPTSCRKRRCCYEWSDQRVSSLWWWQLWVLNQDIQEKCQTRKALSLCTLPASSNDNFICDITFISHWWGPMMHLISFWIHLCFWPTAT